MNGKNLLVNYRVIQRNWFKSIIMQVLLSEIDRSTKTSGKLKKLIYTTTLKWLVFQKSQT